MAYSTMDWTDLSIILDFDNDGYGDINVVLDTCISSPPNGFVVNAMDCNDDESSIYPGATEIPDNDIDEDCSGIDLFKLTKVFPNPFTESVRIQFDYSDEMWVRIYDTSGQLVNNTLLHNSENYFELELNQLSAGIYILHLSDEDENELLSQTIVKY